MTGYRLDQGGSAINRRIEVHYTFDGKPMTGFEGDTLASALIASGRTTVARSFKYHRPRGVTSAGSAEATALMTTGGQGRVTANVPATMVALHDGLKAQSQNAWPSVDVDLMSINQLAGSLFAAGFYYKTFIGPTKRSWMLYEPLIRRAAGMGALAHERDQDRYDHHHAFCDVLVVGGGPAGLAAALQAAKTGARVALCEETSALGGQLLSEQRDVDGKSALDWIADMEALLVHHGVQLMPRTTVYGYYDGNTLGAIERVTDHAASPDPVLPRERHHTIRAKAVILATGTVERPFVFEHNDTPGIMLASAVRTYAARYGVAAGQRVAVFTNNDGGWDAARDLVDLGVSVTAVVDPRDEAPAMAGDLAEAGAEILTGHVVAKAHGSRALSSVEVVPFASLSGRLSGAPRKLDCDCLAMSAGHQPLVHLASQAGTKPVFDEAIQAFLPGERTRNYWTAGSVNGALDLGSTLKDATKATSDALKTIGLKPGRAKPVRVVDLEQRPIYPLWEVPAIVEPAKKFVDLQHDVTAEDVRLAHREGFRSVEHLKRYTTLGMAGDQGKTSNVNGLTIMAAAADQTVAETGTTRFRPPYAPVSLGALAGRAVGSHFRPLRRTPMHDWHVTANAEMLNVGPWQRPRVYYREPGETLTEAYIREARDVRAGVGIADVSTLGKIMVQGPDAAAFLNRIYVNGFAKLPVGKARYGVMLRDDGFVFDDGTTWRLSETDFLMTTTTAQAGPVMSRLEFLLATAWPDLRVALTSVTEQWAGMAVSGPDARAVLARALDDVEMSNDAFPFMAVRPATCRGVPVLVARLSFSGELAYEVYAGAHHGSAVWQALLEDGRDWGLFAYGLEALGALRIEKGHVAGTEIDGRTTIDDLGLRGMVSTNKEFVGKPLMDRPALTDPGRLRLVGLETDEDRPIRIGSHIVSGERVFDAGKSQGHVTAYTYSPALGKHIALALVERGPDRIGEQLFATFPLKGEHMPVRLVSHHFYDPEGARLHV